MKSQTIKKKKKKKGMRLPKDYSVTARACGAMLTVLGDYKHWVSVTSLLLKSLLYIGITTTDYC